MINAALIDEIKVFLKKGADIDISISTYVDIAFSDGFSDEFDFLWKAGRSECFRYKQSGAIVHLQRQSESYKIRS
jgi:hypothetical protein